jgi:hypothetical protein
MSFQIYAKITVLLPNLAESHALNNDARPRTGTNPVERKRSNKVTGLRVSK